jgi:hypothetical protein
MENTLRLKIIDKDRPMVNLLSNDKIYKCLVDTGADTCVFTHGVERLMDIFPNAKKREDVKIWLSGFGTGGELVDVYTVDDIIFTDSYNSNIRLSFKNVDVACCVRKMRAPLIVSASLLKTVDIHICNRPVNDKYVGITYDRDAYYCNSLIEEIDGKLKVVKGLSIFALE